MRLPTLSRAPGALLGPGSRTLHPGADPGHGVSGHSTRRRQEQRGTQGRDGPRRLGPDGLRVGLGWTESGPARITASAPRRRVCGRAVKRRRDSGSQRKRVSLRGREGGERRGRPGPQATVKQLLRPSRASIAKAPFRLADKASFQIPEDVLGRDFVVCVCLDTLR